MRQQTIVDKMMQESNEADDGLAARKIFPGEWITVRDQRDKTYRWYHDSWDADKLEILGGVVSNRNEISEEQAALFLFDVKE